VNTVGTDPGEGSNRKELWSREISQGGESTDRVRRGESRNPADRQICGEAAGKLTLRRRKDQSPSGFGIRGLRGKSFMVR
jgi:hypothetical protein